MKVVKHDSNTNVAKPIDENKLAQDEMVQTLIESVLPVIKPLMKPATKKFTEWMNEGNMIMIRSVKGEVNAFHIKSSDVESFKLKEGKEPVNIYNIEELIEKILSGNFSDL